MGTKAGLTVEEYLRTSFPDLDQEYRDGELEQRSLPDRLHSHTQAILIAFFFALRKSAQTFPLPELRLKIRSGRFLIPDVSVFHPVEPQLEVPDTPPLVVIEILCKDDRMTAVSEKLREYHNWGVQHVWLVDPHSKRMYTCDATMNEVTSLRIPELGIELGPADLFE